MTKFLRASAVGVLCTIGAIAVSNAQTVTCQNAQYDPEVLARFPNLAKACSEIISKDGADYAVVKARLDRVDPSGRVAVRVKQPDGNYSKPISIQAPVRSASAGRWETRARERPRHRSGNHRVRQSGCTGDGAGARRAE